MKKLEHKICAVLFTDICNSTGLKEQLGEYRFDVLRQSYKHECVKLSHKGEVLKDTGDGLLIIFSRSADAVEAALAIRDATGLALHYGIDFGELIAEKSDVHGSIADRASRVNGLAGPGRILVTEAVYQNAKGFIDRRSVSWRDRGEYELQGISGTIQVWEPYNANIQDKGQRMNSSKSVLITHLVIEGFLLLLILVSLWGVWNLTPQLAVVESRITEANARLDRIENLLRRS